MWKIKNSSIHASGVFATKIIKKNTKIIEYIGEKVTRAEGNRRSEQRLKKYLNSNKTGSVYIFELNSKFDIDGSPSYNKARYINHSCNPNCEVDIIDGKIWIIAIKKINKGDELTYDYGYEFDKDDFRDHVCKCGEKKCIGFIISENDRLKYLKFLKKIIRK